MGMTKSFGAGEWDAYIVKLDVNGKKLWEKTFGGNKDDLFALSRQKMVSMSLQDGHNPLAWDEWMFTS
ncbi:hypothetical protein [Pseudothermotoga sp.]